MNAGRCEHPSKVTAAVEFHFARKSAGNGDLYSTPVSVSGCGDCGQLEFHRQLCDWLRSGTQEPL